MVLHRINNVELPHCTEKLQEQVAQFLEHNTCSTDSSRRSLGGSVLLAQGVILESWDGVPTLVSLHGGCFSLCLSLYKYSLYTLREGSPPS